MNSHSTRCFDSCNFIIIGKQCFWDRFCWKSFIIVECWWAVSFRVYQSTWRRNINGNLKGTQYYCWVWNVQYRTLYLLRIQVRSIMIYLIFMLPVFITLNQKQLNGRGRSSTFSSLVWRNAHTMSGSLRFFSAFKSFVLLLSINYRLLFVSSIIVVFFPLLLDFDSKTTCWDSL